MSAIIPPNGRNGRPRTLARWHRRLGLVAAVLVLVLAISGLLLSHAAGLGLDRVSVHAPWLLRHYEIEPRSPPRASKTAAGWLVWIDGRLFLDGRPLVRGFGIPLGTAGLEGMVAVAAEAEVLLLTPEGEVIERIGMESLPGTIEAIGHASGDAIAVLSGGQVHLTRDFLDWEAKPGAAVTWGAARTELPKTVRTRALAAWRGEGLPLTRLLADVHSGRFFGAIGPYLMDAAAIALIALAISGLVIWTRRDANRLKPPKQSG